MNNIQAAEAMRERCARLIEDNQVGREGCLRPRETPSVNSVVLAQAIRSLEVNPRSEDDQSSSGG